MPSDSHFSHAHRLPLPSHRFPTSWRGTTAAGDFDDIDTPRPPTGAASSGPALFASDPAAAYVGQSPERLTRILVDDQGAFGVTGEGEAEGGYRFPDVYTDPAAAMREARKRNESLQGIISDTDPIWGGEDLWRWADEEIRVSPNAFPDTHTEDLLPSETHSSYPFGRPFHRPSSLHPRASLPKYSARPQLTEAALWNGVIQPSSGAAPTDPSPGGGTDDALSQPLLDLPLYLQKRILTSTLPASPAWPFPNFGPGRSHWDAVLDPRFVAHARIECTRDAWLELGLDELLPRGREQDPLAGKGGAHGPGSASRPGKLADEPVPPSAADTHADARRTVPGLHARTEADLALLEAELLVRQRAEEAKGGARGEAPPRPDEREPEYEASRQLRRVFAAQEQVSVPGASTGNAAGTTRHPPRRVPANEQRQYEDAGDDSLLDILDEDLGDLELLEGLDVRPRRGEGPVDRFGTPADDLQHIFVRAAARRRGGREGQAAGAGGGAAAGAGAQGERSVWLDRAERALAARREQAQAQEGERHDATAR